MPQILLIVQKPTGSQKELFDELNKERRHRWFSVAHPNTGLRWHVIATFETYNKSLSEQQSAEPDAGSLSRNKGRRDKLNERRVYRSHVEKLREISSVRHGLAPEKGVDASRDGATVLIRPVHLGGSRQKSCGLNCKGRLLVRRPNYEQKQINQPWVSLPRSCWRRSIITTRRLSIGQECTLETYPTASSSWAG